MKVCTFGGLSNSDYLSQCSQIFTDGRRFVRRIIDEIQKKEFIRVINKQYHIFGETKNGLKNFFNGRILLNGSSPYLKITTAYPSK